MNEEHTTNGLRVERVGDHEFVGRNERGATVRIGRSDGAGSFSPGELLQIALAGCMSVTVEELVTRRAGADARMVAVPSYERGEGVREYERLRVALETDLSFLDDATRARVIRAMRLAVERQCTVSRTIERGVPVEFDVNGCILGQSPVI